MAKKHAKEPVEEVPEVEETPVVEDGDARPAIGVDVHSNGAYDFQVAPKGWHNDRVVFVHDQWMEHVGYAPDGTWLYRGED